MKENDWSFWDKYKGQTIQCGKQERIFCPYWIYTNASSVISIYQGTILTKSLICNHQSYVCINQQKYCCWDCASYIFFLGFFLVSIAGEGWAKKCDQNRGINLVTGPRRGSLGELFVLVDWRVRVFWSSGLVDRPPDCLYVGTFPLPGCMDRRSCYIPLSSQVWLAYYR